MKFTTTIILIITTVLFTACDPSDEEKASSKLKLAQALLEKKDTLSALKQLDSLPVLFPKAEYALNASQNLRKEVQFDLLHRKETMLDTLKKQIIELEKPFEKEKTE